MHGTCCVYVVHVRRYVLMVTLMCVGECFVYPHVSDQQSFEVDLSAYGASRWH